MKNLSLNFLFKFLSNLQELNEQINKKKTLFNFPCDLHVCQIYNCIPGE